MTDPKEIYLEPACCADPCTGRTWAADQPWERSPECADHQPATRYVRADIHEAALKRQESETVDPNQEELITMYIGGTKADEIRRSSDLLDSVSWERGAYFVIAFLYDAGYGREEMRLLLEDMERRRVGFRTPKE